MSTLLTTNRPSITQYSPGADILSPDNRPMVVSADYFGVLPDDAFEPDTDFTRVYLNKIRKRSVSLIDGVEGPFRVSGTSFAELDMKLRELGVSDEIRAQIYAVIQEGGNAPKYEILTLDDSRNKIAVVVSFADRDPRMKREDPAEHSKKNTSKGGGGWTPAR